LNQILKQPGRFETVSDLIGSTSNLVRFGLDDDFYNTLSTQIKAINLETTQAVANQYLTPDEMTWLVITDLNITRSQLEELFDEIIILEL
jgi:zinc protease